MVRGASSCRARSQLLRIPIVVGGSSNPPQVPCDPPQRAGEAPQPSLSSGLLLSVGGVEVALVQSLKRSVSNAPDTMSIYVPPV
jgi:hypothetical protein